MVILDANYLSILEWRGHPHCELVLQKLDQVEDGQVYTTIISFEEQVRGWMAAIAKAKELKAQIKRYRKLHQMLKAYCSYSLVDFDENSAVQFQRLRKQFRRKPTMDLKIASIALANKATLVTRNLHDFRDIPGLKIEDWIINEEAPHES